jgi:hypothetical protein
VLSLGNFKAAVALLQKNYKGTAKAIPWANIIALVMSLITGCFPTPTPTPADVRGQLDTNPEYLPYAVRVGLRDDYGLGAWKLYDGPGVCAAIAATLKDPNNDNVIAACLADAASARG